MRIFKICYKKRYVIGSESKDGYSHHDPIKFSAKSRESSLCDHSDAYIFVTRDISVTRYIAVAAGFPAGTQPQRKQVFTAATQLAFKNCASFKDFRAEIDGTFAEYVDFINIAMPICNWIKYSGNYSDSSESSWEFKVMR